MNLPAIFMPAGPMLRGHWGGVTLGSGSDVWKYWADLRAGAIEAEDWQEIENGIAPSPGHCMTMGTASTMTSAVEALGVTLPGAASIPAADSRHAVMAAHTGRRIVDLVWEDLKLRDLLTRPAFLNAVTTVLALGGSTNAIIHLIAMARRAEVQLDLADFDRLSQTTNVEQTKVFQEDVIRTREDPLFASDTLAVLRGNLAPDGAVIKPPAAEERLHRHSGRAVVFANYDDMAARIDHPDLDIDADSVIVLQNAGPHGALGMPEWGQLPIPKKLLAEGVRDMVRISDARMSGTSYGACVLHVAPESAVGGPLALVQDGDVIELDVAGRRLHLDVSDDELAKRRAEWQPPPPKYGRGYGQLYLKHTTQANEGCDFDFLEAGTPVPEPEIH